MIAKLLSWYRFQRMKLANPAYAETFVQEREAKQRRQKSRGHWETRRALVCEMLQEGNDANR